MSCCSGGRCKFQFEEGPPLLDNAVTTLTAKYLFLPYGTLLEPEEVVRIWKESGESRAVILEEKIPLVITESGPKVAERPENEANFVRSDEEEEIPWQLVALDSGIAYEELMNWQNHPLYNPDETAVLLKFNHPIEVKPTLKMRLLQMLYKIRNL